MKRFDSLMTRCPKLGNEVTFSYCRVEQRNFPCTRIISCWPSLPVAAWLRETYPPEVLKSLGEQPSGDRLSIIFQTLESLKKKPGAGEKGGGQ